ncbi:MAG: erythromycin esterase family protein [Pseudonocardia sp.]|nr:erythromycin esterase family protein [Pseudonocardia sp.]
MNRGVRTRSSVTNRAAVVLARGTRLGSTASDVATDDLEALQEIVGGARVVALGESAHFVREFTEVRARLTRLLMERLGFTVFAHEFSVTAGFALDSWIRGTGTNEDLNDIRSDITRSGAAALFRQLREHNIAHVPARFVGIDVPEAGGSLLPALAPVRDYLANVDPGLLPRLDAATELAERFAAGSAMTAIPAWHSLDASEQDALTAALARLRALMHSRAPIYLERENTEAARDRFDRAAVHLDTAIGADHLFGSTNGLPANEQMAAAISLRDRFMAGTVFTLLDHADPGDRIVLVAHNTHIQKTPLRYAPEAGPTMVPMGQHLARALGEDYVAIGLTHTADSVPQVRSDGSVAEPIALGPPLPTSIEAAADTAGLAYPTLVRTRNECGLDGVDRIRAQSGWSYGRLADAFDAVMTVPTATTETDVAL